MATYLVCKRQAWLGYHAIQGDCDNDYLRQGNYIHEEAYKRQKRNNQFEQKHFDTVQHKNGQIVVGEVKKSSHCLESAKMQLAYYLYELKQEGIEAIGVLQFPEEKRTEEVILTEELEQELIEVLKQLEETIREQLPPRVEMKKVCEHCSYCESCWA